MNIRFTGNHQGSQHCVKFDADIDGALEVCSISHAALARLPDCAIDDSPEQRYLCHRERIHALAEQLIRWRQVPVVITAADMGS